MIQIIIIESNRLCRKIEIIWVQFLIFEMLEFVLLLPIAWGSNYLFISTIIKFSHKNICAQQFM